MDTGIRGKDKVADFFHYEGYPTGTKLHTKKRSYYLVPGVERCGDSYLLYVYVYEMVVVNRVLTWKLYHVCCQIRELFLEPWQSIFFEEYIPMSYIRQAVEVIENAEQCRV